MAKICKEFLLIVTPPNYVKYYSVIEESFVMSGIRIDYPFRVKIAAPRSK